MKRPDKIVKWFSVEKVKDDLWVDFNGKPSYSYVIKIPYWLGRAYRLRRGNRVKVEIRANVPSMAKSELEETKDVYFKYFRENWSEKITRMRKLNHNYMMVQSLGKGKGWFKSIQDYNNYHKELKALNEKYGTENPILKEG